MTLSFSIPSLSVRAQPSGVIEGYGSVFGIQDSHGDIVLPGAFAQSLKKGPPLMLWAHDQSRPIGRWVSAAEDSRGLHLKGQLNLQTDAGNEAYAHLNAGDVNGLSIGYTLGTKGAEYRNGTRHLTDIDLREVSVVALPSNDQSRVISVKTTARTKPSTLREFETALRSIGFSRGEAEKLAAKGWAVGNDETSAEIRSAIQRLRALKF